MYFTDYTTDASQDYLSNKISDYSETYGLSRTPFKMTKNQITNKYCSGDCLS